MSFLYALFVRVPKWQVALMDCSLFVWKVCLNALHNEFAFYFWGELLNAQKIHVPSVIIQGGEDLQDAISWRSFSAKEPSIIRLFCRKWPVKIRHPMGLAPCSHFVCTVCPNCVWQFPLKIQQTKNLPDWETQIPRYLAVPIQIEIWFILNL